MAIVRCVCGKIGSTKYSCKVCHSETTMWHCHKKDCTGNHSFSTIKAETELPELPECHHVHSHNGPHKHTGA